MAQFASGELSSEELVIQAARADRDRLRSGAAMRPQVTLILVLVAVTLWLVLMLGRVPDAGYIGVGLAALALVVAGLVLLGLVDVSPLAPWGNAVRGRCPRCGQRTLRESRVLHWEVPGPGKRPVDGIVTLCMAQGCEHAAVRDLKERLAALGGSR